MLDKDKFRQAFLEEAREILLELESSLLALNDNRGDNELVGRAFRALHTIKGSGAMFGLTSWPRSVTTWKTPSTKFATDGSRSRPNSLTFP